MSEGTLLDQILNAQGALTIPGLSVHITTNCYVWIVPLGFCEVLVHLAFHSVVLRKVKKCGAHVVEESTPSIH